MKDPLRINCSKETRSIVRHLKEESKRQQKTKAILGLSGGIDSAVVAFLCKRAGLDLQLVLLPYKNLNQDSIKSAQLVIKALGISRKNIYTIKVAPGVIAQVKELKRQFKMNPFDEPKIRARQRYIILSFLARHFKGLLIGTEHLSEYWLGHFFIRGDFSFDINPIAHLWKTQVYQLARYLGVPPKIIERGPTASHWPGQTDENILGFSYKDADPILYWFVCRKYSPKKIVKELGYDADLVERVINQVKRTSYKRQTPPKGYWL